MPRSVSIEDQLSQIAALGNESDSPEARKQLRKHLSSKNNLIAAKAAEVVERLEARDLMPDLVSAFHRFMQDAAKSDKGCAAKFAIVKALVALESFDAGIFRTGVRHVQHEPTWGGRSDTAAPLRALCGLALVQAGASDAMNALAELLADGEADARIGAAHALGYCGLTAIPLLRFKVLAGDQEAPVLAECLTSLMRIAPNDSLEFVARFVDPRFDEIYEHAALALAESRSPAVFEMLKEKWTSTFDREFKQALLLPLALTRSEESRDFLISVIEAGEPRLATAAINALSIYRGDVSVRKRAAEAIAGPKKSDLLAALNRAFE